MGEYSGEEPNFGPGCESFVRGMGVSIDERAEPAAVAMEVGEERGLSVEMHTCSVWR